MIHYIKGEITFKSPTFIVVETGGIGYKVNISLNTYAKIEKLERVKILTTFLVKEDSQTLFGFADDAERQLFSLLLSVSGVGPSTTQVMLSSMTPDEIKSAIIGEDVNAFKKVKGVGPKTAKRIILDLKDKILKDGGDIINLTPASAADNTMRNEALMALVGLGFSKISAQKALNKILKEQKDIDTVQDLIKAGLNALR
ncbi:MAG: Holliday junction DNA helicase RuvA [Saprospiraceae bacterium]|jgi:Holliday junction DNA helicase RuvA